MSEIKPKHLKLATAVREIHLERLGSNNGLTDLQAYQQVLVIFRFKGAVVGKSWLPVKDGQVSRLVLQDHLTATAWPVWQQLMAEGWDQLQPLLPTASVVVCTRNRTDDLQNCLPGLAKLAKQGYEVVIIDNCPADDKTEQLVANYPEIRYIYESRPGLNIARNRGLDVTTGEIVAFTDDDAQVDEGWLEALLANFDDPTVAVVTGITLPIELETLAQRWFEYTNSFSRGFVRKRFDITNLKPVAAGTVGAGVNMAIRRSSLNRIGLFDEALDGGTATRSGGDQEFFYRVLARGYRIVYEPAALVWHRHRRDWPALRSTFHTYGVGLFAWWFKVLIFEKDLSVLRPGLNWFWTHHVRNLVRAFTRRRRHNSLPLDLAAAEFFGALAGPISYLQARQQVKKQLKDYLHLNPDATVVDPIVASRADGVEPLGGGPAEASTPSPAVIGPIVASGASGVEPLGGEPAEASTPSPAVIGPIVTSGASGVEPLGGEPAEASTPSPTVKTRTQQSLEAQ